METAHPNDRPKNQVRNGAVAELNDSRAGLITEIDRKGLSFRQIIENEQKHPEIRGMKTLNILHNEGYSIKDIPCSIVVTYELADYYISQGKMVGCRVLFDDLDEEQKTKLDYFLAQYTYLK